MEPIMTARQRFASDISGLIRKPPLSRRDFMGASAAVAAGYTLAAGPVRAEAIKTDPSGLQDGMASVNVEGGDMPVYFAKPANSEKPPIILVAMEIFGLHEYIKDVTRRLGKLGALAVAPDYYFRLGNLAGISEIKTLMPLVNSKPDAELLSDLDAAVGWAEAQGGDRNRIGIIGFCRGGRTVWEYCAASGDVKAGVAFYGSLNDPAAQKAIWPQSPLELAPEMKAPVLGLYGADDQGIPPEQVEQMKAALAAAGKASEIKIYPGAGHGFHADYRPSYNKAVADDAWLQLVQWFKKWKVLD